MGVDSFSRIVTNIATASTTSVELKRRAYTLLLRLALSVGVFEKILIVSVSAVGARRTNVSNRFVKICLKPIKLCLSMRLTCYRRLHVLLL